jgi:MoaA/NifB/PqqE/SkfB family radical SAM enzyme
VKATGCEPLEGFHPLERDALGSFVWTVGRFALRVAAPSRYLLFEACYEGQASRLHGGAEPAPLRLGWQTVGLDLGRPRDGRVELAVDPLSCVPEDPRALGLRIRRAEATNDAARFRRLVARDRNFAENEREFRSGAVALGTVPPHLRVTVERACNVVPRCVYCEWDWAKSLERGSPLDVARDGIASLGLYGELAVSAVDCSYGEPFLNRSLGDFLEDLERRDVRLEMTCNGQVLGENERRAVLGKDVVLHVSIEAATRESYARLRNDAFDLLVENVRALCREKKQHGGRPRVVLAFILMRSTAGELRAFFDLARDVGADGVKLRTLFAEGSGIEESVARGGAEFRYADEGVSPEAARELAEEASRLAAERGLLLHVDMDEFGRVEREDRELPLCSEPWRTAYVLNRGVMPCCFGKRPVADLRGARRGDTSVEDAIRAAIDGEEMREIRAALARRELPRYCRESLSCPIVKRRLAEERGDSPRRGRQTVCDPRTMTDVPT